MLLGVAVVLAGCGPYRVPIGPGPVAMMRVGDDIALAVCASQVITRIVGEYREYDSKEWVTFLDATGRHPVERGDELDLKFIAESFDDVFYEAPLLESVAVNVRFEYADSALLGLYRIGAEGLPGGQWLHNNGTLTAEPCSSSEETEDPAATFPQV